MDRTDLEGRLALSKCQAGKTAEQAAAFRAWSESSGIDWTVPPTEQPPETRPPTPPEGEVHGSVAVDRKTPRTD
jgi:hypothetical protein